MGRDKALLPYRHKSLVEHVAQQLEATTNRVSLIGNPDLYGHLGYPVYADRTPAKGPLGGIYAAVSLRHGDWNLILACDLPNVRPRALRQILVAAEGAGDTAECVVPRSGPADLQPLCAAYHARCLPKLERALGLNRLKLMDLLAGLECVIVSAPDPDLFLNVNTPADWAKLEERQSA